MPSGLGGLEVFDESVDVDGATERVGALVEHGEPVTAEGEEVVHRDPERFVGVTSTPSTNIRPILPSQVAAAGACS